MLSCWNGIEIEKDDQKAVKWYQKAAEQGHTDAQYNLALCYKNGIGVEKDEQKAVEWYQKAAEQRDAWAQYNLALCCMNGTGVEKNEQKAVEWYKKQLNKNMPVLNIVFLLLLSWN